VIRNEIALSNVCSNLRGCERRVSGQITARNEGHAHACWRGQNKKSGQVRVSKSQACWAVRQRISCTKIEGNAEAGQKQARSSINDTFACRAGADRARESGHPRFHRCSTCLLPACHVSPPDYRTGLLPRPSTFCGSMEAWLAGLSHAWRHGQDHDRPQMPPLPCWQTAVASGRPTSEYFIR
jgi:hypothetical protein